MSYGRGYSGNPNAWWESFGRFTGDMSYYKHAGTSNLWACGLHNDEDGNWFVVTTWRAFTMANGKFVQDGIPGTKWSQAFGGLNAAGHSINKKIREKTAKGYDPCEPFNTTFEA